MKVALIYLLNGLTLNLLGKRQPAICGTETLTDVEKECIELSAILGLQLRFLQSNAEHQIIDWVHEVREAAEAIVVKSAAPSHASVTIIDALNTFDGPVIEVQISNIHRREIFRHHPIISARADGVMAGCGMQGYELALVHLAKQRQTHPGARRGRNEPC